MATMVSKESSIFNLGESGLNPELGQLLHQMRRTYQENKTKNRQAQAKRKRQLFIAGAVGFFALTTLLMIFFFSGLLTR
jgi:hypothetical protein